MSVERFILPAIEGRESSGLAIKLTLLTLKRNTSNLAEESIFGQMVSIWVFKPHSKPQ